MRQQRADQAGAAAHMSADHQVLEDAQAGKQLDMLEDARNAVRDNLMSAQAQEILGLETDAPAAGIVDASEQVEQRGLAGPVGSDQRVDLTCPYGEFDPLEGGAEAAEALADVVRLEERGRHRDTRLNPSRAARLPIPPRSRPSQTGRRKYDENQQQGTIGDFLVGIGGAQQFRSPDDDRRPDDAARNRAQSTDHDHCQHLDRFGQAKGIGRYVGKKGGIERAGDTTVECTDGIGGKAIPDDRYAHDTRRDLAVSRQP